MEAKTWTAEEIREKVSTDDRWAIRALLALYNRQTADEQSRYSTVEHNGVGFSSPDASFLTRMARFYKDRGFLSPKQMRYVRFTRNGKPRLAKYAKQLAAIAAGK